MSPGPAGDDGAGAAARAGAGEVALLGRRPAAFPVAPGVSGPGS
jgi:hypothetical protein